MSCKIVVFSPSGLITFAILVSNLCMGEKYSIVHWGDVSAQLERFYPDTISDTFPTPCTTLNETCVGGLANLMHYIKKASSTDPDVPVTNRLKLSTGNLVGGENGWMSVLGWNMYSDLLDRFYQPTAMSLGLKEFGAGLIPTIAYTYNTTVPIVLTNVKCPFSSDYPEKYFCDRRISMHKLNHIGLLGFVNPIVMNLSSPGNLEFEDITTSLKKVVDANLEFKTFIAIGDGSLDIAKSIIDKIPRVKLVIYSQWFKVNEDMTGEYPLKYGTGYIATPGEYYGSSIGKLILDIDDETGNICSVAGSELISTSGNFGNVEPKASELVNKLTLEIENEKNNIVGHTTFKLEGGKLCWRQECDLGNLVTDAMVHCAYKNNFAILSEKTPLLSLWHGGAMFDDTVKPNIKISKMDIHYWLPYHNRANVVRIEGSDLWKVFQASALGITADETVFQDWGQFLQVSSGLEIYYDTRGSKPELKRIRILHEEDGKPVMKDIEMEMEYYFVIPSFIHEGRSVYEFAKSFWKPVNNDFSYDDDCVEEYIRALRVLRMRFEKRIWINDDGANISKGSNVGAITLTFLLTLIVTLL